MEKGKPIHWQALPALAGKVYADMVMEALKQAGIQCYLKSLYGSGGLGVISGAGLAGARDVIMVPEDRFEEALEIMEGMVDHL